MASLPESAAAIRERWERDGFVVVRRVFTDKALLRLRVRLAPAYALFSFDSSRRDFALLCLTMNFRSEWVRFSIP